MNWGMLLCRNNPIKKSFSETEPNSPAPFCSFPPNLRSIERIFFE